MNKTIITGTFDIVIEFLKSLKIDNITIDEAISKLEEEKGKVR
jgi:hypothetical protein